MKLPKNSIPMMGGPGPFGYIDMGGLFTVLKIRNEVGDYADPGWYQNPQGTVATVATDQDLGVSAGKPAQMQEEHHHHG
jgi:hypothetical protein